MMRAVTTRNRWIAVVCALAAASCLLVAVAPPDVSRWWSVGEAVSIGPSGTASCFGSGCQRGGFDWLAGDDGHDTWRQAGRATRYAGWLGAALLVALAAALASKRKGGTVATLTITAMATAAIAGGLFVALFPAGAAGGAASLDRGVMLFGAGVLLATGTAIAVLRG